MISTLKRTIRKAVLGYDLSTYYFAQSGEDAILQSIFSKKLSKKEKGFYVDIGSYHPYKGSNTYLFYINGWNGINIDACPGSMKKFKRLRPRDINLEIGIGEKEDILTYYLIDKGSTMNSFSKEYLQSIGMFESVKEKIPVKILPLASVLDQYASAFDRIDILSIDVEGFDMEVITSNDWTKYRPRVIVIELNSRNINDLATNETAKYLCNLGYEIVSKTVVLPDVASVFFVDKEFDY